MTDSPATSSCSALLVPLGSAFPEIAKVTDHPAVLGAAMSLKVTPAQRCRVSEPTVEKRISAVGMHEAIAHPGGMPPPSSEPVNNCTPGR